MEKYRKIFDVEEEVDQQIINEYTDKIVNFQGFLKKVIGSMIADEKQLNRSRNAFHDSYEH